GDLASSTTICKRRSIVVLSRSSMYDIYRTRIVLASGVTSRPLPGERQREGDDGGQRDVAPAGRAETEPANHQDPECGLGRDPRPDRRGRHRGPDDRPDLRTVRGGAFRPLP